MRRPLCHWNSERLAHRKRALSHPFDSLAFPPESQPMRNFVGLGNRKGTRLDPDARWTQ